MTPITFKGYHAGSREVTVIAERITHWTLVDYNGNYGTMLHLDTGKEVIVGEWPSDVEKKLAASTKESTC